MEVKNSIEETSSGWMVLLCSVFTPYYNEDVMYSKAQLEDKNVDGINILYYLQTIVPGSPIYFEPLCVESTNYMT